VHIPAGFTGPDDLRRSGGAISPPDGRGGFLGDLASSIGRLIPRRKPDAERPGEAGRPGWQAPRGSLRYDQVPGSAPEWHPAASAEIVFWDALHPVERDAFRTVATTRTFAAGARLITEGDQADHVIVILSGRTTICAHENGRERLLAERGPGQLVGERAVLQASFRSASVIARDQVQALVARTTDFAAFISAHPRVLEIVESQLSDRHIEDPARYGPDVPAGWSARETAAGEGGRPETARPTRQLQPLKGENCTVILSDVVGFGAFARTDDDRRLIREALFGMTHAALRDLPDAWSWEDRGDGLLTVVPPSIPTALAIRRMHTELPPALEEYNRAHDAPARIQLRIAVNVGPVVTDAVGVTGEAIIVAARLVEAPLFKQAMDTDRASLGIIASSFVYDTVIRHDLGLSGYSPVQAAVKESHLTAWMKLFSPRAEGRGFREWHRTHLIPG
jgi:class 3 adenylate cyclase